MGEPSSGRSIGGTEGSGRWFAGFHRFTLKPKSVDSRPRPPVDHIASIGDFGWDDGMALRDGATEAEEGEGKTAWHAMPWGEEEGPGGDDATTGVNQLSPEVFGYQMPQETTQIGRNSPVIRLTDRGVTKTETVKDFFPCTNSKWAAEP